jgi:hypothetical protein
MLADALTTTCTCPPLLLLLPLRWRRRLQSIVRGWRWWRRWLCDDGAAAGATLARSGAVMFTHVCDHGCGDVITGAAGAAAAAAAAAAAIDNTAAEPAMRLLSSAVATLLLWPLIYIYVSGRDNAL